MRPRGGRRRGWPGAACGAALFVLASAATGPVAAQPAAAPAPVLLRDVAERRFAAPDGLRSLAVFAVEVLRDGSLWIGTNDGPHRYVGGRFEPIYLPGTLRHVRAIIQSEDGDVWFATRVGVMRRDAAGRITHYDEADGVPAGTVYSLLTSDAVTGQREVIAASGGGLVRFDGARWHPVPLPDGVPSPGLVAAARSRPGARDELWIANMFGAVARLRDGLWSPMSEPDQGMRVSAVERFLVAGDSARTLYVATAGGVFTLDEAGGPRGRWRLLPGSPTFAYRLALVPNSREGDELWVSTLDGLLMRRRAARWDTIALRSTDPRTPVHALTAVAGHAGGQALYVGSFGDGLVRLTLGRAATLVSPQRGLRLAVGHILEEPPGEPGTTWLGTGDFGVSVLSGMTVREELSREAMVDGRTTALLARRGPGGVPERWIAGVRGVWRRENGRWVNRAQGLGAAMVAELAAADAADERAPMLAATDSGLFTFGDSTWTRVAGTPAVAVQAVLGARDDDRRLWAMGPTLTLIGRDGRWRVDSTHRAAGFRGRVAALCRLPGADGVRLLAGGDAGLLVRDGEAAPWRPLPEPLQTLLPSRQVTDLRCDEPAQVLVATVEGLAVLDLSAPSTERWRFVTSLGPADGLPSPHVLAIGQGGRPGPRWIGTAQGVGHVDLTSLLRTERPPFRMELRDVTDSLVTPGATLRHDANRVVLRLDLPTFHREEDQRFLVELDGSARADWSTDHTVTFPALPPGTHTVRAWARDYAGREYGPVTHTFRIAYPPWRSPLTLWSAGVLTAGLLFAGHRWRLQLLRARAEALEASERRVRENEAQLRALFDRAHDPNLLSREGVVVLANDSAGRFFGVEASALAGRPLATLGLAEAGAGDETWETVLPRGDGRLAPVSTALTRIGGERGVLLHWVLRDLSDIRDAEAERQRLEAQVRETQKMESLGTLAGGVAHDFNNLLGVIRGNAELARDALHDPDAMADHLAAVLDASERARDLVRQILMFSRRTPPTRTLVDLADVVRTLQPMLRALIPRTIDLEVQGDAQPHPVLGDVTQLQQLVFNLCSNAEYAMRPTNGGRLRILLDRVAAPAGLSGVAGASGVVRLRVADTGVGMPPEVAERVFEPFFTTKPTGEGTGLGLSVLHGIVAAHGGRVSVRSAVGDGTTFEVLLPEAPALEGAPAADDGPAADEAASARRAPVTAPATDADPLASAKLVLVDDEPEVARVMQRVLARHGADVQVFQDPQSALAHVERAGVAVDVLVTDQTMPGMSGDVLAERVRAARPALPVLLVTGYSYRLTPERLRALGVATVLQKPVPMATLVEAVRDAVRTARASRSGAISERAT